MRATLAGYFGAGALLSLAGLGVAGELRAARRSSRWSSCAASAVGFALSGPLRRRVDAGRIRTAILVVCASSALALVVRSLV